ncbi:GPI-anchor transamidase subunit K [Nematocida sp. AWRm80]|nr:GPI-anchor transamidase subunit K [Nematocida sp. AWRm80]
MKFRFVVVSLVLIPLALCLNKAILINCSWQYENYRHFSNVLAFQSLLEKNGYHPKDISVFMKEDLLEDKRTTVKKICIGNTFLEKGKDYTPKRRHTSFYEILDMISGNDPILDDADENTNLLIYMTGHGGNGFIKYCNRKYFYKDDVTEALSRLQRNRVFKRVLFISDTCQASSLIDLSKVQDNVTFISSSLVGESSHSANFNEALNVFPIDLFVQTLYSLGSSRKLKQYSTASALIKAEMPVSKMLSTVTLRGPEINLADFLYPLENRDEENITSLDL